MDNINVIETPETGLDVEIDQESEVGDPGQQEGSRKPNLAEGPAPDHPRFKQIYGKMKEYERRLEEVTKNSNNLEVIEAMKEHNAQLSSKLAEVLKESHKDTMDVFTKQHTPDPVQLLEDSIKTLNTKREEYRKAMEHDKADTINDQLIEAKVQLQLEKAKKTSPKEPTQELNKEPKPSVDKLLENPEELYMKTWVSKNPWFDSNPAIRKQAIEIDKKLLSSPEWANRTIIERLGEVENQIKNIYSGKTSYEGFPSVEGTGGLGGSNSFEKKVTLTPTQVEIAKGLGITPQEYAKQLTLIKRR